MRRGPLHVAEPKPSGGNRRPGHHGHKPLAIFAGQGQSNARRVVRMFENLQERGWTFKFSAEATSPRGFKYAAEGASPLEAFLKAFGQWQSDLASFAPKIRALVKEIDQAQAFKRKYKKSRIKELLLEAGPEIARVSHLGPKVPPSPDQKVNDVRIWRRLYMRAYRRKRPAPCADLVAA